MLDNIFVRARVIERLRENPLGPILEQLATDLYDLGYALSRIQDCLRAGAKFGHWLHHQDHSLHKIDEAILQSYRTGLARYAGGQRCKAGAGLELLFTLLRQQGIVEPLAKSTLPIDQWLDRYDNYLQQVAGLADSTRKGYLYMVHRFIDAYWGKGEPDWSLLNAKMITGFVQREAMNRQGSGRQKPSAAVRSFLRFLVFLGEIRPGLEAAAPLPSQWTHAALPVRLTSEEVEQALAVYRDGVTGNRRNYAILLLLARLGLRAGEIIALRLDDIDWYEGRLLIRPGKTHQQRCLPLAHDVGGALADYLKEARPQSDNRQVFLHKRAPYTALTTSATIRWIVVEALRHAGIEKRPHLGSHLLRHTAASQMLNQGADFKDIADVLGHRCLATTGIYAKLELNALASVAQPWPGGEQ